MTALSLETLHDAVQVWAERNAEPRVLCVNAALAGKAGEHHLMRAENPVYIISGDLGAR